MENREFIVKIFSLKSSIKILDNVKFIRIMSDDYNLLIMKDYLPAFGEINGTIGINTTNDKLEYKDVEAFYTYRDNVFNLMIRK